MALLFLFAAGASAATWTVNTTDDSGTGSCSTTKCSLRDAINTANDGDTVTFSVTGTIVVKSTTIVITRSIIIQGPATGGVTVDGGGTDQVFFVYEKSAQVTIDHLTVAAMFHRL